MRRLITVGFDHRVEDDPDNPFGIDFLVFGNQYYMGNGYVNDATNMNTYMLAGGSDFERTKVSVSQDGITWYRYDDGPYADDHMFATHAYRWDADNAAWTDDEMDWTRPVDPVLAGDLLAGGMSAAQAIVLYGGSAGGTGFDLSESAFEWIQYVKVEGLPGYSGAEIDGFADVAPIPEPTTVALLAFGSLATMRRGRRWG